MRLLALALMAWAALLPQIAQAAWLEASSAHFVVYADDSERDIRQFAEQLERYHSAMAYVTATQTEAPSPSNRVVVFVVRNEREIRRLADNRNIGGFYIPRAGGSVAFVPRVEVRTGQPDLSMITLLHEYAHHFLISGSNFPSTRWLGEGAAEFFASAEFTREGGVGLGRPALHRGGELAFARNVTVAELVDPAATGRDPLSANDAFYGKSWLLYHYLMFNPERQGQLRAYVQGMAGGKSSREAAEQAFGSLAQLERELQTYLKRPRMNYLALKPEMIRIGPIAVRPLTAGEVEIMAVRIRSRRGVDSEEAATLVVEARAVAARHPGDPGVLAALAEAEYDAGFDEPAIAAADAALALDPAQVNAYVQKGYALFRRAA
ncbi:MAG: hypothetical protein B7Z33_14045 [Sphingomonadales bacterium 12-68-11]|nr:MAG: hypothetical protein B7Z33_14045 [Sphingomonadales bacterium 12-68-11]OYX16814.1 MAG: hypothetical protein B7Z07_01890 [Sphingomonadales bacterium 32-67-7]